MSQQSLNNCSFWWWRTSSTEWAAC